jgi:hypothetical protein
LAAWLCAFLRSHCIERSGFLFYVLAAAFRTAHFFVIVFVKGKNAFEGFLAILARVVVHGHETPPAELRVILTLEQQGRAVKKGGRPGRDSA